MMKADSIRPRVLLVGDARSAEMKTVLEELQAPLATSEVRFLDGLEEIFPLVCEENWYPDLGVVLQSFPEQYPVTLVHQVLGQFPLSHWLCCYGCWCEADGRTRKIWPEAIRVPLRDAEDRVLQVLKRVRAGAPPWPVTSSLEETIEQSWTLPASLSKRVRLQVEVISPDAALKAMLEDLLRSASLRTGVGTPSDQVRIRLWDVDPLSSEVLQQVEEFHQEHPQIPIIALMTLPFPEDHHRLAVRGVSKLLPKPFAHHRLIQTLNDVGVSSQKAA